MSGPQERHTHVHSHPHGHGPSDPDHEHSHDDRDHEHEHDHEHVHQHDHAHEHDHDHAHEHDHDHAHGDGHEHTHGHGHHHRHGEHDHDHAHGDHDHDHQHGDHDHDHDHHHHHGSDAEPRRRPELPRGAGTGKTLFLDAPSGIAGDMTVAALVDLGVPFSAVIEAVGCLGIEGFSIEILAGMAGAIGASRFEVSVDRPQPERSYAQIDELIACAPLPPRTQSLARA